MSGFAVASYFVVIDFTVIITCVLVSFPALSTTVIVTLWGSTSVPSRRLGTDVIPALNWIILVASLYSKKSGKPVTVVDLIPLPPALSSLVTAIFGSCPSTAIKSQFCPFVGACIAGFVTSFTFNWIVTSCSEPSIYVTFACIVWFPYVVVLIDDFDSTFEIFVLPFSPCALVALTAPFNISDVTSAFWFTSICVPVAVNSSLTFLTVTFTVTTSFDPSGYVISTSPVVEPGALTTGGVFHVTVVPSGNPCLFTLSSGFGVCP